MKSGHNIYLRKCQLFTGVPSHCDVDLILHISGTQFQSDGDALQLPMVELPSWGDVISGVQLDPETSRLKFVVHLITLFQQVLPVSITELGCDAAWHNHHLFETTVEFVKKKET